MPRQTKVELYAAIRRDARAGMSGRASQTKYGIGWRTVQAATNTAWPSERKVSDARLQARSVQNSFIDEVLRADLRAPHKQRHTIKRLYARLLDEHGMDEVAYQTLRDYIAERKPQIRAEEGKGPAEVFIRQTHRPGEEAEVDFGDVTVRLRGELVVVCLFALRMSFSGKAVHRCFLSAGQEAFFEGHVHAFEVLGGVPFGKIRYDNLRAAVARHHQQRPQ